MNKEVFYLPITKLFFSWEGLNQIDPNFFNGNEKVKIRSLVIDLMPWAGRNQICNSFFVVYLSLRL